MCQTVLEHVFAHESETFNVEDEILRKRTEWSVADHDVSHESTMVNEADMDFRIPGLPTFRCEVRAENQRSRIYSENGETSRSTCSSTRSSTKSIM